MMCLIVLTRNVCGLGDASVVTVVPQDGVA
jgi:hypothetical protein